MLADVVEGTGRSGGCRGRGVTEAGALLLGDVGERGEELRGFLADTAERVVRTTLRAILARLISHDSS